MRDLVHNSPALRHRRELFATGLIDNPRCPCDLAERRKLREGFVRKWSDGVDLVKGTKELPPIQSSDWDKAEYFGNGHLATHPVGQNGLTFLHILPVASQKPVEGWSTPPFSYEVFGYAIYPPENVIAVAEQQEK